MSLLPQGCSGNSLQPSEAAQCQHVSTSYRLKKKTLVVCRPAKTQHSNSFEQTDKVFSASFLLKAEN